MRYIFSICLLFYFNFSYTQIVEWVDPQVQDLGTILEGETIPIQFRFKNTTNDTLFFDNIRPQCGCTSAHGWETQRIAPQASSEVQLEFQSAKIGKFYKKVKVYFNLQKKAEILYIEGIVAQ